MIASCISCRFFKRAANLLFYCIPKGRIKVMLMKLIWDGFLFSYMVHYYEGRSHSKTGKLWHVGTHMISSNTQRGCGTRVVIGMKWAKTCAMKTLPTPLHHLHLSRLLTQGRHGFFWAPLTSPFVCLGRSWWSPVQTMFFFCLNLSRFGEPVPTVASAFCSWLREAETDMVICRCGPSAERLRCFAFCVDVSLLITIVQSGILSYFNLSFSSSPIFHWPLSPIRCFHPQNCSSLYCYWTSQEMNCYKILKPAYLAPKIIS